MAATGRHNSSNILSTSHIHNGYFGTLSCITHHIKGYLRICNEAAIQQEVANLLDTSPQAIPCESRCLLEIQYHPMKLPSLEHSSYWVLAMKAAKHAVKLEQLHRTAQGAGAHCQESRQGTRGRYWNIMEGVRESLRRRTQLEEQSRKQSSATETTPPKQICWERTPSVSTDGSFRQSTTTEMKYFFLEQHRGK
jgi:hypothetical protein